jgi:hypothetical protein
MKTILSHFYNEEYLLPWWLNHHKKYFDHGILIDYHSTDQSVEIIKSICPDWKVVTTVNDCFDARKVDQEIMHYESEISGWKIALNTTEFLYGDFNILKDDVGLSQYLVQSLFFVSNPEVEEYPDTTIPLHCSVTEALDFNKPESNIRGVRSIHNHNVVYDTGRHWSHGSTHPYSTNDLKIFYYGFAPYNEKVLQRKLQIQNRIPQTDKSMGLGFQHVVSRDELIDRWKSYYSNSINVLDEINKYVL